MNAPIVYHAFGFSACKSRSHQEILENRHTGERTGDLERARDTTTGSFESLQMSNIGTLKENPSLVSFGDAGENIEHGRFARAVWANYPKHFPFIEMHAQIVDGYQRAKALEDTT